MMDRRQQIKFMTEAKDRQEAKHKRWNSRKMEVVERELDLGNEDVGDITGVAIFLLDIEEFYDSDIGGTDGLEVTGCTLDTFTTETSILDRPQLVVLFGEDKLKSLERDIIDDYII